MHTHKCNGAVSSLEVAMELKICAILLLFSFRPKTMDYSQWFDFWESKNVLEKRIPLERASQGEQNGTNFSFVAPSSEEFMSVQMLL